MLKKIDSELQIHTKGLTLLELLIVIAIIAILSAILIFVLNPAETLRKSRDSQRISDLNTLNRTLAFLITKTSNPVNLCGDDRVSPDHPLHLSLPSKGGPPFNWILSPPDPCELDMCSLWDTDGDNNTNDGECFASSTPFGVDGAPWTNAGGWGWWQMWSADVAPDQSTGVHSVENGWMATDFLANLGSEIPISKLPIDPVNRLNVVPVPSGNPGVEGTNCPGNNSSDDNYWGKLFIYRFSCMTNQDIWEIDAAFESNEFKNTKDRDGADGGDNSDRYELGTSLRIIQ